MKRILIAFVLIALQGCASSTPQIIVVTATNPPATETLAPTDTPTSVPTETPSPTATPDVRVIDQDPRKMVLPREILPSEGKFRLVYETPHRNSEILSSWGVEEGREYLDKSGRVDGWTVYYDRGTAQVHMPEYVTANAVLFKTQEGVGFKSLLDHRADNPCSSQSFQGEDYVLVQGDLGFGQKSFLCLWKEMQDNGKYYVVYYVDFDYRNVGIQMWAEGYEDSFDKEWVIALAERQMDHLLSLPLSSEVTFQP